MPHLILVLADASPQDCVNIDTLRHDLRGVLRDELAPQLKP
jgi:hypothetical protein